MPLEKLDLSDTHQAAEQIRERARRKATAEEFLKTFASREFNARNPAIFNVIFNQISVVLPSCPGDVQVNQEELDAIRENLKTNPRTLETCLLQNAVNDDVTYLNQSRERFWQWINLRIVQEIRFIFLRELRPLLTIGHVDPIALKNQTIMRIKDMTELHIGIAERILSGVRAGNLSAVDTSIDTELYPDRNVLSRSVAQKLERKIQALRDTDISDVALFFHQLFLSEKLLAEKIYMCQQTQESADRFITSRPVPPQNAFILMPYGNEIPAYKYLLVATCFFRAGEPYVDTVRAFLANGYSPLELFSYRGENISECLVNGMSVTPLELLARLDDLKTCLFLVNKKEQVSAAFVNALVEGREKNADSFVYWVMSFLPATGICDKAYICESLADIHKLLNNGTPLSEIGFLLKQKAEQLNARSSLSAASYLGHAVDQKLLKPANGEPSASSLLITYRNDLHESTSAAAAAADPNGFSLRRIN